MSKAKVISICSQKGGVGKTTTAVSMSVALAKEGNRVLLVDFDPQGDSSYYLGWHDTDIIDETVSSIMKRSVLMEDIRTVDSILVSKEGVDLIPANPSLVDLDIILATTMSRELVLKKCLNEVKGMYDYILIDCQASLGLLTVNALAASDSIIIPVEAAPFAVKDMTYLFKSIGKIMRGVNPKLKIEGVVLTLVDNRTKLAKQMVRQVREAYGNNVKVFDTVIPRGVTATESTGSKESIFEYDEDGSVAKAYEKLTKEVLEVGEKRKHRIRSAEVR